MQTSVVGGTELQRIADSPLSPTRWPTKDRRQRFVRSIGRPFRSGNSALYRPAPLPTARDCVPSLSSRRPRCSSRLAQLRHGTSS